MSEFRILFDRIVKENIPANTEKVAICLSGGVDSLTCGFALESMGVEVVAYTFKIEGIDSQDADSSREASEAFGWEFHLIEVPINNLKEDFLTLASKWKCIKKTQYECTWPFIYIVPEIKETYVLNGIGADSHYGLSKRAMIHYRHTKELMNEFRAEYFALKNPSGLHQLIAILESRNKILYAPYYHKDLIAFFRRFSWDEINRPKEKQLILDAYPEYFSKVRVRKHANLQIVAGVREVFETLLDSDLNKNNRTRVMDLCRDYGYSDKGFLSRQEIMLAK